MSLAARRHLPCKKQIIVAALPAFLLISLAAQAPAPAAAPAAAPQVGYVALGKATLNDARGTESGSIKVEVWGASHCRVTLDFSRPGETRKLTAVLDGTQSAISGPDALTLTIPAPSPVHGCGLLPQSSVLAVASPQAARSVESPALRADPASGLPQSLTWKDISGRQVEVAYSAYASPDGVPLPTKVTESVAGAVRLTVEFNSLTTHSGFTAADFALPPPHPPAPRPGNGGGQ